MPAWTVLLLRAVVVHPAGCSLPSPYCGMKAIVLMRKYEAEEALTKADAAGAKD